MNKYIIITALILTPTAWAMNTEKETTQTTATDNIKKIISSFHKDPDNKKDGYAILDIINTKAGIRTLQPNLVGASISHSTLFQHSKL